MLMKTANSIVNLSKVLELTVLKQYNYGLVGCQAFLDSMREQLRNLQLERSCTIPEIINIFIDKIPKLCCEAVKGAIIIKDYDTDTMIGPGAIGEEQLDQIMSLIRWDVLSQLHLVDDRKVVINDLKVPSIMYEAAAALVGSTRSVYAEVQKSPREHEHICIIEVDCGGVNLQLAGKPTTAFTFLILPNHPIS